MLKLKIAYNSNYAQKFKVIVLLWNIKKIRENVQKFCILWKYENPMPKFYKQESVENP